MAELFDASYTPTLIRFWRIPGHREALNVLAEATSQSDEADYLAQEWNLISLGNQAEAQLRRIWEIEHPEDPEGWKFDPQWFAISRVYGPPPERHAGCLCRWLHARGVYSSQVPSSGGAGDAGGRARRLRADLDSAALAVGNSLPRRVIENAMARRLGWLPHEERAG